MCVRKYFSLLLVKLHPPRTTPTSKCFQHSLMWKMTKQLTNSLHSCQTKKSQLWKLRTHDLKNNLICINYACCWKRLLNRYLTHKHYAHIGSKMTWLFKRRLIFTMLLTFGEVLQTISCSTFYSCDNITTTWIQISRLFYFEFFSKINHQMMI